MKKTESVIRIAILIALAAVGTSLVFCEEQDENLCNLLIHVILDKALGAGCIYTMVRLYSRWRRNDRWIARYDAWAAKDLEQ